MRSRRAAPFARPLRALCTPFARLRALKALQVALVLAYRVWRSVAAIGGFRRRSCMAGPLLSPYVAARTKASLGRDPTPQLTYGDADTTLWALLPARASIQLASDQQHIWSLSVQLTGAQTPRAYGLVEPARLRGAAAQCQQCGIAVGVGRLDVHVSWIPYNTSTRMINEERIERQALQSRTRITGAMAKPCRKHTNFPYTPLWNPPLLPLVQKALPADHNTTLRNLKEEPIFFSIFQQTN